MSKENWEFDFQIAAVISEACEKSGACSGWIQRADEVLECTCIKSDDGVQLAAECIFEMLSSCRTVDRKLNHLLLNFQTNTLLVVFLSDNAMVLCFQPDFAGSYDAAVEVARLSLIELGASEDADEADLPASRQVAAKAEKVAAPASRPMKASPAEKVAAAPVALTDPAAPVAPSAPAAPVGRPEPVVAGPPKAMAPVAIDSSAFGQGAFGLESDLMEVPKNKTLPPLN
ncbi:hypothetical protein [Persicirhabdus sediminis]|uniref:Uncharacterized protein n=1 Tax=Persicirhabdus sediminis TaxID=454144 RepID=A0A8J7ME68_9BACT|nr:hypothetical protein [Persicirhabdus sediminis]MBK1791367.1 hypothetical protein [Persicirhabdus sediminis]